MECSQEEEEAAKECRSSCSDSELLLSSSRGWTLVSCWSVHDGGEEGVCAGARALKMAAAASPAGWNGDAETQKGPWLLAVDGYGTEGGDDVLPGRDRLGRRAGVCRLVRRVRRRGESGTRLGGQLRILPASLSSRS